MGGPPGGGDPELCWVFHDVGLRGRVDWTATGGGDVFVHAVVFSFHDFLYDGQYGVRCAELPSFWWNHCGDHEGTLCSLLVLINSRTHHKPNSTTCDMTMFSNFNCERIVCGGRFWFLHVDPSLTVNQIMM